MLTELKSSTWMPFDGSVSHRWVASALEDRLFEDLLWSDPRPSATYPAKMLVALAQLVALVLNLVLTLLKHFAQKMVLL